ncbi:MAG: ATP-binding cassette domain-containing protein [Clostridiales Family XIII bacterium]|jgi:ABC-type lipoprotein export system ATPase subunit|nr:ATP-binding cassette domain-containing protein [Clostridiales Family XIII bacterium]
MIKDILSMTTTAFNAAYPYAGDFFRALVLPVPKSDCAMTVKEWILRLDYCLLDEMGVEREELPDQLLLFIENTERLQKESLLRVESLAAVGGHDKSGVPEAAALTVRSGETVSVVGPTGSGKSRLLGDIESLARGDTPSGRRILINGTVPPAGGRFSRSQKLVAQLSQNMNFVADASVGEFIEIHCKSKYITDVGKKTAEVLQAANRLAGEPFGPDTPVTALSGGQSRSLMIADIVFLGNSPIVLIDEIENAGIDRNRAVELLSDTGHIVVMATHDPVLALSARRRVVIRNGGIFKVIDTSEGEKSKLKEMMAMQNALTACRDALKNGDSIA